MSSSKHLFLALLILLLSTFVFSQWANSVGGSSRDEAYSIAVDASGNVYVTGSFHGTSDFDPGPGITNLTSNGDSWVHDIIFAKYNSSGELIWANSVGGIEYDTGKSIAVDASGNVYVTGYFGNHTDFDPGSGNTTLSAVDGSDIFFAKYNSSGELIWAKSVGGSQTDKGQSIAFDASGNFYVTGSFNGTVDFDPGSGTTNLSASGGDIFLAKYNSSGELIWAKNVGGEVAYNIAVDASGNVYVTGTSSGYHNIIFAKYNSSGDLNWAKSIDGIRGEGEQSKSIAVDASGNVYLTGRFFATVNEPTDFDPGPGITNLISNGNYDIFFAKYNSSGELIWAKNVGGPNWDYGESIALDASGNVYLTGAISGMADLDPGPGITNLTSNGGSEIFFAKYNSSGELIWAKCAFNADDNSGLEGYDDVGNSIAVDGGGNIYLTGLLSGTVDFDPGPGTTNLTSNGSTDIFIVKYDSNGNLDITGPTVTITSTESSPTNASSIPITITFDESVIGFTLNDITDSEANMSNFSGSGTTYTLDAVPTSDLMTLNIDAGVCTDAAGNSNTAASQFSITYDSTSPTPIISSSVISPTSTSPIPITVTFDEAVTGFESSDITVGNGSLSSFTGSGATYTFDVTPTADGIVTIDIAAGVCTDIAGNSNVVVGQFSLQYLSTILETWVKSAGSGNSDYGESIAVDASGNVYVTGSFQGTADFDPGSGTTNLISNGSYDIFFAKYNSSGELSWAKSVGSSDSDHGKSIAVDASGNVYLTGSFIETADFDPGPGTTNLTANESYDIFFAKYNSSGELSWAKSVGSSDSDTGKSIAVDASGNVYLTGSFRSTADFDPGPGTTNLTTNGSHDIFFAKYNSSGELSWAKSVGNSYNDLGMHGEIGKSIAVDASGNVYVTGYFIGTVDFDPGSGTTNLISNGSYNIFFAKYNSSGELSWANSVGGNSDSKSGLSIAVDASGNVYLTSYFQGTVDFDPGPGTTNLNGTSNVFFAKYNSSGELSWAKSVGSYSDSEHDKSIAVDASGNVYVTGSFRGTADFDPGSGTTNLISNGSYDIFFAKYNSSGELSWAKSVGSSDSDHGKSIAVDASGNVYLTGSFIETADFDPGPGITNLTTNGDQDIFFAKYNSNGVFVITYPSTVLTTTLSSPTNTNPMPFTITFSESVTGFEDSDVTVTNGTVSSISGSGTTYTVNITPTADGTVNVQIPGSIATDSGGEHNSSSNLLQIEYMGSAPGATITSTLDSLTNVSPVPITATFNKSVTGFEVGDLTITNGTSSDFSGSGTTYTFNVTPTANGTVTVEIPTAICTDAAGNTNVPSSISLFYDTTSPSITITSPVTGDSFGIGISKTISWQASDNHGVSKVDISHTIDNGINWSDLILSQEDSSNFIWSIPNTPSEEVQLRFITTDVIGYIDTTDIADLSIVIEYPKVVAVYPEGNKLTWKDTELSVQFSLLLDNTTITSDNVTLSAARSTFTDSLIYDDNGLLTISLSNTLSALDTLTLTLKSGITSSYGYGFDGNGDGIPGDDQSITYTTVKLGDYDKNDVLDLTDLASLVQGFRDKDYSYELAPFTGSAPHYTVSSDSSYDIEDLMAFGMTWNWQASLGRSLFRQWQDEGIDIAIATAHDLISMDIPIGTVAYEVQISYNPSHITIHSPENTGEINLTDNDEESGIYTLLAMTEDRLDVPIRINARETDITLSFRAIGHNGKIISKLTRQLSLSAIPNSFALHQAYPNPFNPTTTIQLDLPEDTDVILEIYDISGRLISVLQNNTMQAGYHSITWNATMYSSGIYFVKMSAGDYISTQKLMLVK